MYICIGHDGSDAFDWEEHFSQLMIYMYVTLLLCYDGAHFAYAPG